MTTQDVQHIMARLTELDQRLQILEVEREREREHERMEGEEDLIG